MRAAVFAYNGELHLEQGFSTDREETALGLLRAWDRAPRPDLDLQLRMRGLMTQLEGCAPNSGGGRVVRQGDEQCLRGVMLDYVDERRPLAVDWFEAIERLLRFAGGLRQRVTVIAFSHGVAADSSNELIEAMQAVYGNTDQLGRMRLDVGFGEGARRELDAVMELALEQRVTLHFVDRMPRVRRTEATRQGWSKGNGGCDATMKLRKSSSGCETRPARGEPARVGSQPCSRRGNVAVDA